MMALEAPMRSSPADLHFSFSKHIEMSKQQEAEQKSPYRTLSSPHSATDSASLRPEAINRISSNPTGVLSPSDIVGPSPVTSNGTETTEIEDDASEDVQYANESDMSAAQSEVLMLATDLPETVRQAEQEEAVSVIHAPESFTSWTSTESTLEPQRSEQTSPRADSASLATLNGSSLQNHDQRNAPILSTDVKPVYYSIDNATPQAQDLKDMFHDGSRLRSSSTNSLEKIDEQTEADVDDGLDMYESDFFSYAPPTDPIDGEKKILKARWNACTTFVEVNNIYHNRIFRGPGTPDPREKAWRSCWQLCHLISSMYFKGVDTLTSGKNLNLCRRLCDELFEARENIDEFADSVLRVSYTLNTHLYTALTNVVYTTQYTLPEDFRERTLEFYLALCGRLIKQMYKDVPYSLGETDTLLQSTWDFVDTLLVIRRYERHGGEVDELDLLRNADTACQHLSDIFTRIMDKRRSHRSTPRASQTSFFSPSAMANSTGRESRASNRSSLRSGKGSVKSNQKEERPRKPPPVPETPVTEFEDTPVSPESRSPQMPPNIMVLGPSSDGGRGKRWSSSASTMSGYSHNSNRTSSTATTTTATEDPNVSRCKVLILRAAMNLGFNKDSITDPKAGAHAFQKFVQSLQTGAFGSLPTHTTLLQQYRDSVLKDGFVPRAHAASSRNKRVSAQEMAKSVHTMMNNSSRFSYLRELFKFVFQFPLEEVDSRRNVSIQI